MLMMSPARECFRWGIESRVTLNVPVRLTWRTFSQASGSISSIGAVGPEMPALLTRACESLSAVRLLDPVHGGGHAEHAHEAAGGFLISRCDRTPLFEPGPETLDAVPIGVDPRRTRHRRLIALGRNRWPCAEMPDEVAKGLAGVAAVGDNPGGDDGEDGQEQRGQRQFVRLTRSQGEANGATGGIGDHAGLGPVAAARSAQCLTLVALL